MELTVKFKSIGLRGNIVRFTEKFECPDFVEYESGIEKYVGKKMIEEGLIDPMISVKSQQEDWLESLDKHYLINEKDLLGIVDWVIVEKNVKTNKTEIEKLKEILYSMWPENEQNILDFLVIYNEMRPSLKGISFNKKFNIVLDTMLTTLKGQVAWGDHLLSIVKEGDKSPKVNILN